MIGADDKVDIDLLEQIEQLDAALEEREGNDRRKKNLGVGDSGTDRRLGDRRKSSSEAE